MSESPAAGARTRILYIAGCSRSGSTLLLRLLGEIPGLLPLGELFDIWDRSYRQNQLCGCGSAFHSCPFWRDLTARAFGCEPGEVPSGRYEALRRRLVRRGAIARLWLPVLRSARYRRHLRAYADLFGRLYRAASEVPGASIVVDSSKQPRHGWLLREIEGAEIHVVHLIRDSRAVAFSWRRQRRRPEIHWRDESMERRPVLRSALDWDIVNLLTSTRRSSVASYTMVRYEDLVGHPGAVLARIARALGETWDVEAVSAGRRVSLRPSHTASGNPSRFTTGTIEIRDDDEWRSAMPRRDRLLVTALTAPLLARYGYPVRTPSCPEGSAAR